MSHFKAIQNPGPEQTEAPRVEAFEFKKIDKRAGGAPYVDIKAKYGSLAHTDFEKNDRNRKDSRFQLSDHTRGSLGVNEEEKRVFQEAVDKKVSEIKEQARKEGFEKGVAEGIQKGRIEGIEQIRKDSVELIARFEGLVGELEQAREKIIALNENFMIRLIQQIARMVLLKDLEIDRNYIGRLVKELVSRVGLKEFITIQIHPKDEEIIKTLGQSMAKSLGELKNVSFETNDAVDGGGCILTSDWTKIDASISQQLKAISEALLQESAKSPEKPAVENEPTT